MRRRAMRVRSRGSLGARAAGGLALGLLTAAMAACGDSTPQTMTLGSSPGSNHGAASGSSSGSGTGSSSGSGSSSGLGPSSSSSGAPSSTGDDGGSSTAAGDDAATTSPEAGGDAPATSQPDAAASCVKGQVTPNEVVMLGDSYLDSAWGNVGPTLMMQAGAMYRHYYIGGAAMAWGNPSTQFYIPYQFDPMALTDVAVMNPSDIKVVIMDGGGNDVLIGNSSCETTAP